MSGTEAQRNHSLPLGERAVNANDQSVRVARDRKDLVAAYRLVYRRYLEKGYVETHPGGIVYHPSFALPTSRTLVAGSGMLGIVGTMTLVGDNPGGLQLEEIYHSEVETLRVKGRAMAEVTCLCIQEESQGRGGKLFSALTKFAIHHAYRRGYDDLLLAIHPRHYRIYWHTFRAYPIGPCRRYPSVGNQPALCCRIDLHGLKLNMSLKKRRYYFDEANPTEYYDGPGICQADHEEFCRMLALSADNMNEEQEAAKRRAA